MSYSIKIGNFTYTQFNQKNANGDYMVKVAAPVSKNTTDGVYFKKFKTKDEADLFIKSKIDKVAQQGAIEIIPRKTNNIFVRE